MPPTTINDILELVRGLSDKHVLKRRPQEYIDGFAQAALSTYKTKELLNQIQHKFFIPDDAQFTEDAYLQSATELTVASYVRSKGVSDFDTEKKVNPPPNTKDVDVYYRVGATRVCLEVKCLFEESAPNLSWTVFTAGHTTGGPQRIRDFLNRTSSEHPNSFQEGKNREMRLKSALVDAHNKFPNSPGLEDLNVLFIACGDFN